MSNQEPTTEQLQKVWKWCGFTKKQYEFEKTVFFWYDPQGKSIGMYPPSFTLDNLFKYAVPKAVEKIARDFHVETDEAEHFLLHFWSNQRRKNLSWDVALYRAIREAKSNE